MRESETGERSGERRGWWWSFLLFSRSSFKARIPRRLWTEQRDRYTRHALHFSSLIDELLILRAFVTARAVPIFKSPCLIRRREEQRELSGDRDFVYRAEK